MPALTGLNLASPGTSAGSTDWHLRRELHPHHHIHKPERMLNVLLHIRMEYRQGF